MRATTAFILVILHYCALASTTFTFPSVQKEAQYQGLLKNLRCLVCQNQDLSDSSADLAQDLRLQVYQLVIDNKTDNEVYDYMTSRYGDFILFKPPLKKITMMLWYGPIAFILFGTFIFWRSCLRTPTKSEAL